MAEVRKTRRHKVDEINLEICDVRPFASKSYSGFIIEWNSDIGFGEYEIYRIGNSDKWCCNSECMDSPEDKDFIRQLMKLFIDKLIVEG